MHTLRTLLLAVLAMCPCALLAQALPPLELGTPASTARTHYTLLQDRDWNPQRAARTMNTTGLPPEEAARRAIMLLRVLEGRGILADLDALPADSNYTDTIHGEIRQIYILDQRYKDIYLEKTGSYWLYSRQTVQTVPDLYQSMFVPGMEWAVSQVPPILWRKGPLLGLRYWHYIAIVAIVVVSVLLNLILLWLLRVIIRYLLRRYHENPASYHAITPLVRPLSVLLLLLTIRAFVPGLLLPVKLAHVALLLLNIAISVFYIVIGFRMIELGGEVMEHRASRTESKADDQLVAILRLIFKILVIVGGLVYLLFQLGLNPTSIIAGLSVGGLAVALAAQDTIKNFFGSLMIFADRPFRIGDYVKYADTEGTVEVIGFRSTRIRTMQDTVVYVPNGKLADAVVDNMGLRRYRLYRADLGLTYDTPPQKVEAFLEGLRQLAQRHPNIREDKSEIHFHSFSNSSLNILFFIYLQVPSWSEELALRTQVNLEIMQLAARLGVDFAFPSQTVYLRQDSLPRPPAQ